MSTMRSIVNYFVGTGKDDVVHVTDQDTYDKDVFDEHLRVLASFGLPMWEELRPATKAPVPERAMSPIPAEPSSSCSRASTPSLSSSDASTSTPSSELALALSQAEAKHEEELVAVRAECERRLSLAREELDLVRADNLLEIKGLQERLEQRDAALHSVQIRLDEAIARAADLDRQNAEQLTQAAAREAHWQQLLQQTQARSEAREKKADQLQATVIQLTEELQSAQQDALAHQAEATRSTAGLEREKEEHTAAIAALENQHAATLHTKSMEIQKLKKRHLHWVERTRINHAHAIELLTTAHAEELAKQREESDTVTASLASQHASEVQSARAALLKAHKEDMDGLRSTIAAMERVHRDAISEQQQAFTTLAGEHAAEIAFLESTYTDRLAALNKQLENLRSVHGVCEPRRLELEVALAATKERLATISAEKDLAREQEIGRLERALQQAQEAHQMAEAQHAILLSQMRDAQAVELEAAFQALGRVSQEASEEAAARQQAEDHRTALAAQLEKSKQQLTETAVRIVELEEKFERATEDNRQLISQAEDARAEARDLRARASTARPVTPVKVSGHPFPSHPTPPETPRSDKRSFGAEHSPTPAVRARAVTQAATLATPSTPEVPEHHCRIEHLSQKYHLPQLMHLPHSMHRCQKEAHISEHAEDASSPERVRRLTILGGRRTSRKSIKSELRESTGYHIGSGK